MVSSCCTAATTNTGGCDLGFDYFAQLFELPRAQDRRELEKYSALGRRGSKSMMPCAYAPIDASGRVPHSHKLSQTERVPTASSWQKDDMGAPVYQRRQEAQSKFKLRANISLL